MSAVRLGPMLREIRLHLCQSTAASAGAREFVSKYYPSIKAENPKLPILIRECSGINPRIWARFPYGEEKSEDISNKSSEEVLQTLKRIAEE